MSDIPFRVTCKGTGESHIIKTDENGYFSSESGWNAHSKNTNGGGAYDGLWFSTGDGKAAVDDSLGAMPYVPKVDLLTFIRVRTQNEHNINSIL